jgi:hypothetical protein
MSGGSFPTRHIRPSHPAALGPSGRGADRGGKQRRDPLGQCPANHGNVRGGVREDRSRACTREQSPAHLNAVLGYGPINARFRDGEKHLDPSETVTLRGAAAEADLRPVHFVTKRSPASSKQCNRRPRCSGDVRGGALALRSESFSRALPAHAPPQRRKPVHGSVARWLSGYPPALANSQ